MRIKVLLLINLFLVGVFFSCSNTSDDVVGGSIDPDLLIIDFDDVTPEEPAIDTSDLSFLPEDEGKGKHVAHAHLSTAAPYGHYLYTPTEYENNEYEYPLLIFLHGYTPLTLDSSVNPADLDNVLIHGPPELITLKKWNPSYPFIVASPQLIHQYWTSREVHSFIEYLMETYRVNKRRIYITGLSLGGGGAWNYVADKGNESYAAAIVPICASYSPLSANQFKNTPVWAFHGAQDRVVEAFTNGGSVEMVNAINQIQPRVRAKVTIYPNAGHNSWTRTYNGTGMGSEEKRYHKFEKSIYDWMLQYKLE